MGGGDNEVAASVPGTVQGDSSLQIMQIIRIRGLEQILIKGSLPTITFAFFNCLFLQPCHGNYFDICSVPACFASWGFKEDLTLWWEGRQTKNAGLMLRAEGSESSMLRVPWEVWRMWRSMCKPLF